MVFNYFLSRRIHLGGSPESKISNAVLLKQSEEFQSVPDGSRVLAKLETQSAEVKKRGGGGGGAGERETEKKGWKKRWSKIKRERKRVREKKKERRPCRKSLMFMHGLRNEPSRRIMHL